MRIHAIWACLFVLLAGGCGGDSYPYTTVTGEFTIDGQAVPKGYVTFSPKSAGQGPVQGATVLDGRYQCEKVPLGDHRVTFVAQAAEMQKIFDRAAGVEREVPKNLLPPAYLQGVDVTVTESDDAVDFKLKSRRP